MSLLGSELAASYSLWALCDRTPFLSTWADPLASKVWDQLEQQIEQGIKASEQEEKPSRKKGDRKKSVSFAET